MSIRTYFFLIIAGLVACDDSNTSNNKPSEDINIEVTLDGEHIPVWYQDNDGDGFGDPDAVKIASESQPTGHVSNFTDCNDADSNINPTVMEVCDDGMDNNCDGITDPDPWTVGVF